MANRSNRKIGKKTIVKKIPAKKIRRKSSPKRKSPGKALVSVIETPRGKRVFTEVSLSKEIVIDKYAGNGKTGKIWKGTKMGISSEEFLTGTREVSDVIEEQILEIRKGIDRFFNAPPLPQSAPLLESTDESEYQPTEPPDTPETAEE